MSNIYHPTRLIYFYTACSTVNYLCNKCHVASVSKMFAWKEFFKIYTKLKTFIEIDPTYIELGRLDDGASKAKTLETQNAVYRKKCYDKIGRKEYNRLWRDSELNHAVRLIQQLSHTREQKLSLEQSYAFFVER